MFVSKFKSVTSSKITYMVIIQCMHVIQFDQIAFSHQLFKCFDVILIFCLYLLLISILSFISCYIIVESWVVFECKIWLSFDWSRDNNMIWLLLLSIPLWIVNNVVWDYLWENCFLACFFATEIRNNNTWSTNHIEIRGTCSKSSL
jgi:hypothetical protein